MEEFFISVARVVALLVEAAAVLGAIAVIRTFLNSFLEKDLEATAIEAVEPAA